MSEPATPHHSAPTQSWDAARYSHHAGFVADLGRPVVALLAPKPGERILDLGCGDGALTKAITEAGAEVIAVDAAPDQVAAARASGLDARICDGQALAFANEFDAVLSNAALHWMTDADAVVAGVRRALKPGSRFVGEMGGQGNIAIIVEVLHGVLQAHGIDPGPLFPWYFPSDTAYAMKLESHEFAVDEIALIPRPTELPTGLDGWLETFGESHLAAVPEARRATVQEEVVERARDRLCDAQGRWWADYVRLRFAAHLPGVL